MVIPDVCVGARIGLKLREYPRATHSVDLATTLAFVCSSCRQAVAFHTSPLSKSAPKNFSVNKKLKSLMSESDYLNLWIMLKQPKISMNTATVKRTSEDAVERYRRKRFIIFWLFVEVIC